jgi:hypothetical protein
MTKDFEYISQFEVNPYEAVSNNMNSVSSRL